MPHRLVPALWGMLRLEAEARDVNEKSPHGAGFYELFAPTFSSRAPK